MHQNMVTLELIEIQNSSVKRGVKSQQFFIGLVLLIYSPSSECVEDSHSLSKLDSDSNQVNFLRDLL